VLSSRKSLPLSLHLISCRSPLANTGRPGLFSSCAGCCIARAYGLVSRWTTNIPGRSWRDTSNGLSTYSSIDNETNAVFGLCGPLPWRGKSHGPVEVSPCRPSWRFRRCRGRGTRIYGCVCWKPHYFPAQPVKQQKTVAPYAPDQGLPLSRGLTEKLSGEEQDANSSPGITDARDPTNLPLIWCYRPIAVFRRPLLAFRQPGLRAEPMTACPVSRLQPCTAIGQQCSRRSKLNWCPAVVCNQCHASPRETGSVSARDSHSLCIHRGGETSHKQTRSESSLNAAAFRSAGRKSNEIPEYCLRKNT